MIRVTYGWDTDGTVYVEAENVAEENKQPELQVVNLLQLTSGELADMRINIDSV